MAINSASEILSAARRQAGLTQRELARRAGTAQSVVARIESGKSSPTIETMERLLAAAGCVLRLGFVPAPQPDPLIERYKQDVDRTLLRENLRKTPDQRLRELVELAQFGDEVRRAVLAGRRPG